MKLFREHRGGLAESLATTIECPNGIKDIKAHCRKYAHVADVLIDPLPIPDDRLPEEWGCVCYYVYTVYPDNSRAIIGMSNFHTSPQCDFERLSEAFDNLEKSIAKCVAPLISPILNLVNCIYFDSPPKNNTHKR